jgi:methionyl aminopeptidase
VLRCHVAQFEHTVAVTRTGARVLTLRAGERMPD